MAKKLTLTIAATCLALVSLGAGSARADTFSGSCEIKGIATFAKPLTSTKAPNTYVFRSGDPSGGGGGDPSSCSGTLNGKQITERSARASVDGPGALSCAQGESTNPGRGKLTLTDSGSSISFPFRFEFTAVATEVDFSLTTDNGGAGSGHASFAAYSPPQAPVECAGVDANGDGVAGLPQLGFDASLTTSSPLFGSVESVDVSLGPSGSCKGLEGRAKTRCLIKRCKKIEKRKRRERCIRKAKDRGGEPRR